MQWVAEGKTSWEIGEILGIAKSTVDDYIASVCLETNGVNRTQALVECIRFREICI